MRRRTYFFGIKADFVLVLTQFRCIPDVLSNARKRRMTRMSRGMRDVLNKGHSGCHLRLLR